MRRLARQLFTLCSAVSLVVCVSLAALTRLAYSSQAPPEPPVVARIIGRLHASGGAAVSLSRDGTRLLTAGGKRVRVWDAGTLQPVGEPVRFADLVRCGRVSR